jgi:hypothetical protein
MVRPSASAVFMFSTNQVDHPIPLTLNLLWPKVSLERAEVPSCRRMGWSEKPPDADQMEGAAPACGPKPSANGSSAPPDRRITVLVTAQTELRPPMRTPFESRPQELVTLFVTKSTVPLARNDVGLRAKPTLGAVEGSASHHCAARPDPKVTHPLDA